MKLHTVFFTAFPILLCCAGIARADETFVYTKLGAPGAAIGLGAMSDEHVAFRVGIRGAGSATHDRDLAGNNYLAKLKPGTSLEALMDWYPSTSSGFRTTGGLVYLGKLRENITAIADAAGSYSFNNRQYAATDAGEVSGKISFNKLAPYLGVGWDSAMPSRKGWRFTSDAGVMLLTGGKTSLSATGAANNAALQQDIEAERSRIASESGSRRRAILTLSLGVGYTF